MMCKISAPQTMSSVNFSSKSKSSVHAWILTRPIVYRMWLQSLASVSYHLCPSAPSSLCIFETTNICVQERRRPLHLNPTQRIDVSCKDFFASSAFINIEVFFSGFTSQWLCCYVSGHSTEWYLKREMCLNWVKTNQKNAQCALHTVHRQVGKQFRRRNTWTINQ